MEHASVSRLASHHGLQRGAGMESCLCPWKRRLGELCLRDDGEGGRGSVTPKMARPGAPGDIGGERARHKDARPAGIE